MRSFLLIHTFPLIVTVFELFITPTGTGIIAPGVSESIFHGQNPHNFRSRETTTYQLCKDLHREINMMKKNFPTSTEIIHTRFSSGSGQETVLVTFPSASKQHVAFTAYLREGITLILSKLILPLRICKLGNFFFHDIAQKVVWLYKMIARVEVTIVLQSKPNATCFFKNTHS